MDATHLPAGCVKESVIKSDEVACSEVIICTLSVSEREEGGGSMGEHLTCPPGAAEGLNVALPPDNAQHNAA